MRRSSRAARAPPRPLIIRNRGIDLVGAVEIDVQRETVIQLIDRDSEAALPVAAVSTLVATAMIFSPSCSTRSPSRRTIRAAVEPDPRPTIIPSSNQMAAAARPREAWGIRWSWHGEASLCAYGSTDDRCRHLVHVPDGGLNPRVRCLDTKFTRGDRAAPTSMARSVASGTRRANSPGLPVLCRRFLGFRYFGNCRSCRVGFNAGRSDLAETFLSERCSNLIPHHIMENLSDFRFGFFCSPGAQAAWFHWRCSFLEREGGGGPGNACRLRQSSQCTNCRPACVKNDKHSVCSASGAAWSDG